MLALGIPASAMRRDRAQEQSEYGGEVGNLIVRLPRSGGHPGASRLLMTHLDTVALCRGARPRLAPAEDGRPARIVNDSASGWSGVWAPATNRFRFRRTRRSCAPPNGQFGNWARTR